MKLGSMVSNSSVVLLVALGVVICVGRIGALTEQEVGIDGMRCDSCGMECSNMCGSRSFRICCLNYVKKRSGGDVEGQRAREGGTTNKGRSFGPSRKEGGVVGVSGAYSQDPQWILFSSPGVVGASRPSHEDDEVPTALLRPVYSRML